MKVQAMSKPSTHLGLSSCRARFGLAKRAAWTRRSGAFLVRAEEEKKEPDTVEVSFDLGEVIQSESSNAALGYTSEDSAGQENIFAVEPRVYVAGSGMDDGLGQDSTVLGIVLGIAAVGLVGAGLFLLKDKAPETVEEVEFEGPGLSYYIEKFSAQSQVAEESVQSAPEIFSE